MIFLAHNTHSEDNTGRQIYGTHPKQSNYTRDSCIYYTNVIHDALWRLYKNFFRMMAVWSGSGQIYSNNTPHSSHSVTPGATPLTVWSLVRPVYKKNQKLDDRDHMEWNHLLWVICKGYWLLYIMLQNRSFYSYPEVLQFLSWHSVWLSVVHALASSNIWDMTLDIIIITT